MRVSELLALKISDIIVGDRVLVRAGKGSSSYIIWLPLVSRHAKLVSEIHCDGRLFPVEYMWYYRQLKRAGLDEAVAGKKNSRASHKHRYTTAGLVCAKSDSGTAGSVLHHKSDKSINYYL